MVSTTQHLAVKPASIWRKFVRLINSILELMQHPALALLVGIALCCTAAGQTITTSLAVSSGAITVGASETLTATVMSGGLPVTAGSVEFRDNLASPGGSYLGKSAVDGSGSAQLILPSLGMGLHEISAIYTGSSGLAVSVSAYQAVTVTSTSQLPTTTAISSTGVAGNYSLTGTVTALTSVLPTGIVSFLDASNGNASLATQTLNPTTKGYGFATFSTATADRRRALRCSGRLRRRWEADLAVANSYYGTITILKGDGAGNFTSSKALRFRLEAGRAPNRFPLRWATSTAMGTSTWRWQTSAMARWRSCWRWNGALLSRPDAHRYRWKLPVLDNSGGDFPGNGELDLAVADSGDSTVSILGTMERGSSRPRRRPQ